MVYQFFDKNTLDETVKNKGISNKTLAEELRKPIFRKSVKKTSTITLHGQYLGRRSSRYAINKQI